MLYNIFDNGANAQCYMNVLQPLIFFPHTHKVEWERDRGTHHIINVQQKYLLSIICVFISSAYFVCACVSARTQKSIRSGKLQT